MQQSEFDDAIFKRTMGAAGASVQSLWHSMKEPFPRAGQWIAKAAAKGPEASPEEEEAEGQGAAPAPEEPVQQEELTPGTQLLAAAAMGATDTSGTVARLHALSAMRRAAMHKVASGQEVLTM